MDEPTTTPATRLHTDVPEVDPSAATPADSAATDAPLRSRRGVRVAGLAVAATVLLTVGAGAGAWGAMQLTRGGDSSTAAIGGAGTGGTGTGGTGTGGTGTGGSTGNGFGGSATGPGGFGGGFGNRFGGGNGFNGGGTGIGSATTATGPDATAAQKVGVVTIDTTLGYEDGSAAGTGIILTSTGEILTNNHVVSGATAIKVTVESTGTTYTATVVGTDATHDVAVLQLTGASGLRTATLASTAAVAGDAVTAVGNAGGTGTLTTATGTITRTGQTITTQAEGSAASETLHGLLETDADIIAGDSGGPLTDSAGAVVGIDTAASSGTSQPDGYAIPIATATAIAAKIEAGTRSSTITLGYPAFLGIEVGTSDGSAGAAVGGVLSGTPAATAGLAEGDVITEVDGHTISSGADLSATLKTYRPGATVSLTWTDTDGTSHTARVTLIQGPAN